ncbi:MAG: HNH endonuclease [Oscillospiraceae bacterium]|jgi:hypothetical protein|nr:HNH endonuclease [Oscillospiraceae bacterium]
MNNNTMNSGVSKALRRKILERDSYTCIFCDNAATDIHHIVPRSRGGKNSELNLVCLCRIHHSLIHGERMVLDNHTPGYIPKVIVGTKAYRDELQYRIGEYMCDLYAEEVQDGDIEIDDVVKFFGYPTE